jgi:M6 family metalloprotease-like protein
LPLSLHSKLTRLAATGASCIAALAASAGIAHAAPEKVTPDVTGTQRVLAIGCYFKDTAFPGILDLADPGIGTILQHTHDYFDTQSNHRVDFEGGFEGWHQLPGNSSDYTDDGGNKQTSHCQSIARDVLQSRGEKASDYAAIVMLFNLDNANMSNATFKDTDGTWVRLRYTGGTGGGWTSEAVWAHEMGHVFGLLHSTFPTRAQGNQYNDFQDTMSGFAHSAQHRWNFLAGGVCNGMLDHPRCIYSGEADNIPVDYGAFQKQRLGWLSADQIATHRGWTSTYQLSAPTYNPSDAPTAEKLKLLYVPIPNSTAYYAIEYRRGDDGSDSNSEAFNRGWDSYDLGIRSDRVTVYYVEPDLYNNNAGDLGDANLEAVLNPGDSFTQAAGKPPLTVSFDSVEPGPRTNAQVTVTAPPPVTPQTVLASPDGRNGAWSNHDVTAQLFALDPRGDVMTNAQSYYGIDAPHCNEQTLDCVSANGPFTISGEGVHDVTFFSVDVAGFTEVAQHQKIRIDETGPTTTASAATAGNGTRVTLGATDALSGVAETDYDLDGAGFKPYTGPVLVTGTGAHTLRFRSVDNAGNFETPKQITVKVTAPPPTCVATASPARITKADGRLVTVRVAVRSPTATGVKLVKRSGTAGAMRGWQLGTADTSGQVTAVAGARYTLKYQVTDKLRQTGTCVAKVAVAP